MATFTQGTRARIFSLHARAAFTRRRGLPAIREGEEIMDASLFDSPQPPVSEAEERAWRQETEALLRKWERQKGYWEMVVTKATQEVERLDRRIKHSKAALEDDAPAPEPEAPIRRQDVSPENASMPFDDENDDESSHASVIGAAIDEALTKAPAKGLKCGPLRQAVERHPEAGPRIKGRPNRFYSVLNRRVGKGKTAKRGKYYRLPSNDSPQGETGAVAAPASTSTH
jgi:hypothetical protein